METRLKNLKVDFPFLIAPMVGISHVAFRELIRSYTPPNLYPLIYTEMLSTKRLPSEKEDYLEFPFTSRGETNFVPQLLGNNEEEIKLSIRNLLPLHPFGFDINMGCPATQTLKHNWGVRLLGDIKYAAQVVAYTKKHSPLPVSVKMRASTGREIDVPYLKDFTKALEEAGADFLTLHCRSQGQGHRGYARWDVVAEIAVQRKIPIVANGDIQTWQDAMSLIHEYKVDGAMLARAAIARPWILWQLAHKMGIEEKPKSRSTDTPPFTPEEEGREFFKALLRFSCLAEYYFGDTPFALRKVFFYASQGSKWLFYGHDFYTQLKRKTNLVEVKEFVNDYAEQYPQSMTGRVRL